MIFGRQLLQQDPQTRDEFLRSLGPALLRWAAIQNGPVRLLELLVEAGVDVETADSLGWTSLHHAVKHTQHGTLKALLRAQASVDARTHLGETPLILAARIPDAECISLLLSTKAHVNATDRSGQTPLHVALRSNDTVAAVAKLIAAGANVNKKDQYGGTPLNRAVIWGDLDIVQKLLAAGAEIE
jgi:ankyrin repeat protein